MCDLDGTFNKGRLGANAVLGVVWLVQGLVHGDGKIQCLMPTRTCYADDRSGGATV